MNSREVIENLIRGRKADRIGLYDSIWSDTITKWKAQGHLPEKLSTESGEIDFDASLYFGFDLECSGGWFDNAPIRGFSEVVEESDEWIARRDGSGAVLKYWKHKSGTPEHVDFRMTSRDIWEKDYKPYLLEVDRKRLNLEGTEWSLEMRKKQGQWTFYGHLFIWETMRKSLGDICMFESLALDPDWIHDYNRVYTDFYKKHFQILLEEVGKPDGIWLYEDLGYKNGLFCSPKTLDELVFPYYKEIVDFFHSYDLPVMLHSCGGIEAALPLIVDAGFDALNPMEVKAGCDVLRFAEKYGDRLAFIGGLDSRVLESGDRSLIKREVIRIIEGMKNLGARYIFGTDHSVSPNVQYEDFKYALEIYKDHMMY